MNTKERILKYLDFKGISTFTAEKQLGWSSGAISKAKSITLERAAQFVNMFSDINPTWLISGKGSMISDNATNESDGFELLPHIPAEVAAGITSGFSESIELSQCEKRVRIPWLPRYDYTLTIRGDSMEPEFHSGDTVAVRKVFDFVEWGKTYVVATRDGAVIKRLYPPTKEGCAFSCHSYNPAFPPFDLPIDTVCTVYLVVASIRLHS